MAKFSRSWSTRLIRRVEAGSASASRVRRCSEDLGVSAVTGALPSKRSEFRTVDPDFLPALSWEPERLTRAGGVRAMYTFGKRSVTASPELPRHCRTGG